MLDIPALQKCLGQTSCEHTRPVCSNFLADSNSGEHPPEVFGEAPGTLLGHEHRGPVGIPVHYHIVVLVPVLEVVCSQVLEWILWRIIWREGLDLAILWQASLCLAMSPTIPCQNTASADLSFMRSTPWCAACRRWRMEGLRHDHEIPQHDHIVHDVHAGLVGVVGLDVGREHSGILQEP